MANYYVDLDDDSNVGSVGSAVDPFGRDEFEVSWPGSGGPDDYYLRGQNEITQNLIGHGSLYAWDADLYGPWRIHGIAFTMNFGAADVEDGVLVLSQIQGGAVVNRCYAESINADARLAGSTDSILVVGAASDVEETLGGPYTNNIIILGTRTVGCDAGTNFTNNVTDVANFAALTDNWGGVPVDVGGQIYGATFPVLPAWDEPDLSRFNLFPTHGVGAGGAWACPDPMYVDIQVANDDTFPRTGNSDYPADWDNVQDHTSPVAGDTFWMGGTREFTAGAEHFSATVHEHFDGYDLSDPTKHYPWTVYLNGGTFNFSVATNENITIKRLAINTPTLLFDAAGIGREFTFRSSFFQSTNYIYIAAADNFTTIVFDGCTLDAPLVDITLGGGFNFRIRFRHCLFTGRLIKGYSLDVMMDELLFEDCTFANWSEATIRAIWTKAVFTGCTFDVVLGAAIPFITAITEDNLRYSLFGLPKVTDASILADYVTQDIADGLDDETRQGPGAFFFGMASTAASASPTYGKAALTVSFTGEDDASIVDHDWDFGDGEESHEENPTHTYDDPGVYTVTYTASDGLGNTSVTTLTIYVYEFDYASGYVVSKTDYCARFAVPQEPGQGIGWSEYDGDSFPMPVGITGKVEMIDNQDMRRVLVMDGRTFKVHEMAQAGVWQDGVTEYGGTNQEAEILLPEVTPPIGAAVKLKHVQSHVWFRPWQKTFIDATGYTSEGMPDDFSVDIAIKRDSKSVDASIAKQIPLQGQIVFDRHFESPSLQMAVRPTAAPWRLPKCQMWIKEIDTGASPTNKLMSEMTWALEWTEPIAWLSRYRRNAMMNLATGVVGTGSYAALVTGPDGRGSSAIQFGLTNYIEMEMRENLGVDDFTINGWFKDIDSATDIIDFTDVTGGKINVGAGFPAWAMLTFVKYGDNLIFYINGTLYTTISVAGTVYDVGDTVRVGNGICKLFDFRVVKRAVSVNAIRFLYNDTIDNAGNSTLQVF